MRDMNERKLGLSQTVDQVVSRPPIRGLAASGDVLNGISWTVEDKMATIKKSEA